MPPPSLPPDVYIDPLTGNEVLPPGDGIDLSIVIAICVVLLLGGFVLVCFIACYCWRQRRAQPSVRILEGQQGSSDASVNSSGGTQLGRMFKVASPQSEAGAAGQKSGSEGTQQI